MIKLPDKIGSNNTSEYAIADFTHIAGSRSVNTLNTTGTTLYSIPDSILSSSGDGSDSLGQCWFVESEQKKYYLTNWSSRRNSSGWVSESFFSIGNGSNQAFQGSSGYTLSLELNNLKNRVSSIESLYTVNSITPTLDISINGKLNVDTIQANHYIGNFTDSLPVATNYDKGIASFFYNHFSVSGGVVSLSSSLLYNLNESVSKYYVDSSIASAIEPKWTTDNTLISNWNYAYNYINTNQATLDSLILSDLNILSYFHLDEYNRLYTELDFYSLNGISAYGMTSGGTPGSGGTGSTYVNLLYNWVDYTPDKFNYVLSALLGNDLNTRVSNIESGSTTNIVNVGSGNGVSSITKSGNTLNINLTNFSLSGHTHSEYQPKDGDLTSIAGLSGTSGLLKKTAVDTWVLDTASYLTQNQNISLTGDITGSGTVSITTALSSTTVTSKLLTNYSIGTNVGISSTDSILSAFGKIQAQINSKPGTVTSVGLTVPTGLQVTPSSITNSGSFAVSFASGYSIPTTSNQSNWSSAYLYSQIGHLPLSGGTINGPLTVTGLTTFNSNITISNNQSERFIRSSVYGGAIRIRGNSATNTDRGIQLGYVNNSLAWTSVLTVPADNDCVLIGTTTYGGYKLDVSGSTRIQGELVVPVGVRFGAPNSTNTNKYGVSFRSDFSSSNPLIGMYFGSTVDSGTHGAVNGNGAMYFTIDDTLNRGWIFRQNFSGVEQNVASISNTGNLTCSGEVTAYSASDIRLKYSISTLTDSLEIVNKLNPVSYYWNSDAVALNPLKKSYIQDFGLIAQEVEFILPELIHDIYGGYKSIDYIKLVPFLIGAIKDLTYQLNELKNKMTSN